jgi:hypothetical protein
MRRLSVLLMAIALFATGAIAPAIAADDNGKTFAQGAFHSLGTGGLVVALRAAAPATPQAGNNWSSVQIFGYGGGPSEGRVYCGDVWNVIVTVNFAPPSEDRAAVNEVFATQTLDGDVVGATDETAVRWSSTFQALTKAYGTFLPPGTLTDGFHVVSQTLEHDVFGVLWAPPPLTFEVNDSAC